MHPLEQVHEKQQQAQKHYHEQQRTAQAQQHSRHQKELGDLHQSHQQQLKQLHQKHALAHEQTMGQYDTMPSDHVSKMAHYLGNQQEAEVKHLLTRHDAEEGALHAQHFQEHLRNHVAKHAAK